jgi:7-cyano-7-deazaguanine synthase in queuosine biosynthesis
MKAVRYVGERGRLPPEYKRAISEGSRAAIVDTLREGGNVTLRAELDGKSLEIEPDALTRDFLELSTLIYIVDELELRKKSRDSWSRRFDIIAPVAKPELWQRHEGLLRRTLHTLSGDEFVFLWCKRPKLKPLGSHRQTLPEGFDAVCLFSGGQDSFLGAYQLLKRGRRVLLVGHQADGMAAPAQKALASWLDKKFPGGSHLVQFRVARSRAESPRFHLPKKREETHRPRSLLFLALAVAVAKTAGIEEVFLPENGLIAINAPLQKSRLGTLSTRTAHPRYLTELADFLQAMGVYHGRIQNPFLFQSKTDMLRGARSSLAYPLQRSVSCARPSRYKHRKVRHCGYCVPCIYRRVAMAEAGLDSDTDYAFSVFNDLTKLTEGKQLDFRALVRFAERVVAATPVERELLVVSHGTFSPDVGERFGPHAVDSYSEWSGMLERWSADFLAKVDSLASATVRRSLGRQSRARRITT